VVDNDGMRLHAIRIASVHAFRVAYLRAAGADPVVGKGERPPSLRVDSAQGITTFSGLTNKARLKLDDRLEQIKAAQASASGSPSPLGSRRAH